MWFGVTSDDIVKRYGELDDRETDTIDAMIEDAQDMLENRADYLGIIQPTTDRGGRIYTRIVRDMVIRVLQNPDGYLTETVDGYTYRRDAAVSSGALYVDDGTLDDLRPPERRTRGAFSIVPS